MRFPLSTWCRCSRRVPVLFSIQGTEGKSSWALRCCQWPMANGFLWFSLCYPLMKNRKIESKFVKQDSSKERPGGLWRQEDECFRGRVSASFCRWLHGCCLTRTGARMALDQRCDSETRLLHDFSRSTTQPTQLTQLTGSADGQRYSVLSWQLEETVPDSGWLRCTSVQSSSVFCWNMLNHQSCTEELSFQELLAQGHGFVLSRKKMVATESSHFPEVTPQDLYEDRTFFCSEAEGRGGHIAPTAGSPKHWFATHLSFLPFGRPCQKLRTFVSGPGATGPQEKSVGELGVRTPFDLRFLKADPIWRGTAFMSETVVFCANQSPIASCSFSCLQSFFLLGNGPDSEAWNLRRKQLRPSSPMKPQVDASNKTIFDFGVERPFGPS